MPRPSPGQEPRVSKIEDVVSPQIRSPYIMIFNMHDNEFVDDVHASMHEDCVGISVNGKIYNADDTEAMDNIYNKPISFICEEGASLVIYKSQSPCIVYTYDSEAVIRTTRSIFHAGYAFDWITNIQGKVKGMLEYYKQVKQSGEDKKTLAEYQKVVDEEITDYYKYLKQTGVPPSDSYLTQWLEEFQDQYTEVSYFLLA